MTQRYFFEPKHACIYCLKGIAITNKRVCMGGDQKQAEYIWDWVKETQVGKLSVSWRCGTEMCKVLRKTSIAYSLEGKGIKSAAEVYHGASKLQTVTRTVLYHRDSVWGSQQRGTLERSSCRCILARQLQTRSYGVNRNQLSNAEDKSDQMRVGASFHVFLNMLDEGLTY